MRARTAIIALALLLAACYRPSSSITSNPDASTDAQPDEATEAAEDVVPEVVDGPLPEAVDVAEEEPGLDVVEEGVEDAYEEPDLGELPVTLAPDFELEDLNPNSPTYGSMRRLSDQIGKVIVFYIGNYG